MKENRLILKKFKILELKTAHLVRGGNGDDGETGKKLKCIQTSNKWIPLKKDDGN